MPVHAGVTGASSRNSKASKNHSSKKAGETLSMSKRKLEGDNLDEAEQKKLLKYQSWDQTDTDVLVTLFAGKRLGANDIDVEYTDVYVKVSLTDGRHWSCCFQKEIDREASKVSLQKMKIILKVKKKLPGRWTSLEKSAAVDTTSADLQSQDRGEPNRNPGRGASRAPADRGTLQDGPPATADTPQLMENSRGSASQNAVKLGRSNTDNAAPSTNVSGRIVQNCGDNARSLDSVLNSSGPPVGRPQSAALSLDKNIGAALKDISRDLGNDVGNDGLYAKEECKEKEEEESAYELEHIKHNFYEMGSSADQMVVEIYIKELDKDSVKVIITKYDVAVKFKTRDAKFISMHSGTSDDTLFRWKVTVVDDLIPEECKSKVSSSKVQLTLKKREHRKWSALEAVRGKNYTPKTESKTLTPAVGKKMAETSGRLTSDDKPTCKVSPMNRKEVEQVVTPGFTGLDNLGNTCFMNSVIQVLANTRELRDYFIERCFQNDLNYDNPLGTGGRLAVAFAALINILWSGKYKSYAPVKLKNLVAQKNSQFMGFAQHDAQEFMAFLLDGMHEDVNRVVDKPYTEDVSSDGRPDHEVADEAWRRYKQRNDSFIVDLFQGQFKSKLVCPVCDKVSITFDPFMHLSVPLPKMQRLYTVIFMPRDPFKKPTKYMLRLPKDSSVDHLKEAMYKKTGVEPACLRVFEAYKSRILNFFPKGMILPGVNPNDKIFACEVASSKQAGEPVVEIAVMQRTVYPVSMPQSCSFCKRPSSGLVALKRCTRCFRTAYCDQRCQREDWSKHKAACGKQIRDLIGQPFVVSLPKSQATYARLCQTLEAFSRYSVDVFQPPVADVSCATPTDKDSDSGRGKSASPENPDTSSGDLSQSTSASGSLGGLSDKALDDSGAPSSDSRSSPNDVQDNVKDDIIKSNEATETLDRSAAGGSGGLSGGGLPGATPTGFVTGRPQLPVDTKSIPFSMRPCDKDGRTLPGTESFKIQDRGEEPLDLSAVHFLGMDWKNVDKCQPYVLVQTKEFSCEEDASVKQAPLEGGGNVTLDECLELFTEPEILSPDHAWYCPQCKSHREASKQMSIWRLPTTLIIQLKRFSFRNLLWRDKIDKMVDFPLRGLDLSEYCAGGLDSAGPPPLYDLYGVVNHHGGILGGHYTSFTRCLDNNSNRNTVGWRLCDDSHVTSVQESHVVNPMAYVLFYRRRDCVVSLSASVRCSTPEGGLLPAGDAGAPEAADPRDDALVALPAIVTNGDALTASDRAKSDSPRTKLTAALAMASEAGISPSEVSEASASATGEYPSATGQYPSATGEYPSATGEYPSATGQYPSATGEYPSATGQYPSATGEYPSATGEYPSATGEYPSARLSPSVKATRHDDLDESDNRYKERETTATFTDMDAVD